MNNHFLTTKNFLKGRFFSILEKVTNLKIDNSNTEFKNFDLIKIIRKQSMENANSVGKYKQKKDLFIIKGLKYYFKNLSYEQLINEANILRILNKYCTSTKVLFPKVSAFIVGKKEIAVSQQFIEGRSLLRFSNDFKIKALKNVLLAFKQISLPNRQKALLPKRNMTQVFFSLPVYFANVISKDLQNWRVYFFCLSIFLKNFISLRSYVQILAHRDLHAGNIIAAKNRLYVLDTEITCLTHPQTDLAITVRLFAKELGNNLSNVITELAKTDQEKNSFLALTAYYALQIMSLRSVDDPDYQESLNYVKDLLPKIYKKLYPKKSLAEKVYSTGLNVISKIMNKNSFENIIIGYHSISNDGWRFATGISNFEKQIKKLKESKKIVSLNEISRSNRKNLAAVTFDDGYLDNLTNALPIIERYKIPATIFVLGESQNANRKELDNHKKLLSLKQIKELHKLGWEIGYHTRTHSDLRQMSDKKLLEEIKQSKEILEQKLGFKIRYFAYPRGIYSQNIIEIVKNAGYSNAFTVDGSKVSLANPFLISRISIEGGLSLEQFSAMISSLGIRFTNAFIVLLKIKEQFSFEFKKASSMVQLIKKYRRNANYSWK